MTAIHVEAHLVDICGQGEAVGVGVEQLVEHVAVDAETLADGIAVEGNVAVELFVVEVFWKSLDTSNVFTCRSSPMIVRRRSTPSSVRPV